MGIVGGGDPYRTLPSVERLFFQFKVSSFVKCLIAEALTCIFRYAQDFRASNQLDYSGSSNIFRRVYTEFLTRIWLSHIFLGFFFFF